MLYAFCRRIVRIMRIYSRNLHSLHQLHSSAKKKFWPMDRMKRMYFRRLTHMIRRKSIETTAADVEYIGSRIVCCHRMMHAYSCPGMCTKAVIRRSPFRSHPRREQGPCCTGSSPAGSCPCWRTRRRGRVSAWSPCA